MMYQTHAASWERQHGCHGDMGAASHRDKQIHYHSGVCTQDKERMKSNLRLETDPRTVEMMFCVKWCHNAQQNKSQICKK